MSQIRMALQHFDDQRNESVTWAEIRAMCMELDSEIIENNGERQAEGDQVMSGGGQDEGVGLAVGVRGKAEEMNRGGRNE